MHCTLCYIAGGSLDDNHACGEILVHHFTEPFDMVFMPEILVLAFSSIYQGILRKSQILNLKASPFMDVNF